MKNSSDGYQVYAKVVHIGTFMKLKYLHNGRPFNIEIPITKKNDRLVVDDMIEMQLLMIKEQGNE